MRGRPHAGLAAANSTIALIGVRQDRARNFMPEGMKLGDGVPFYHPSYSERCIVPRHENLTLPVSFLDSPKVRLG
ncbi:MAG TPA: EVE domain-containing protein [Polaromonas sp.]|nr:EVE domain-containing protein [Polaromonas sp.]